MVCISEIIKKFLILAKNLQILPNVSLINFKLEMICLNLNNSNPTLKSVLINLDPSRMLENS